MVSIRTHSLRHIVTGLLAVALFSAQLLMVLHEGTHDLLENDAEHCDICLVGASLHQIAAVSPPALPVQPAARTVASPVVVRAIAHVRLNTHLQRGPPNTLDA